ncbi:hypothetical protein [Massilia sp. TS11]|uniref:hypothetical protein n=1 Tax=Massilia sp. TS11 TaxID=2908003 RepID=UPI001EDC18CE|nr:hypothetical protein [Massilia sp. TS11]MCG2583426.1 hypothetical protein [Massilia sp. TS11]
MHSDIVGGPIGHPAGVIPVDTSPQGLPSQLAAFAYHAGHDGSEFDAIHALLKHGQQHQDDGKVALKPGGGTQHAGASSGGSGLSGPYDPNQGPDPIVTISGSYDPNDTPWLPDPYAPDPGPGPSGGGSADGGGGGGGGEAHHSAPIPVRHPAHVNMDHLRNTVLAFSEQILALESKLEWAVGIIADASGNLHTTSLIKGGPDSFSFYLDPSLMQPGDQLVAVLHSHPAKLQQDAGIPSYTGNSANDARADQVIINQLIDSNPNGWIDPGMMQYILDVGSKTTYEFMGKGPDANRAAERVDITHDIAHP